MPPADWAEVMVGTDQEVQELLAALHERGLALPEVGFELTGPEGKVLGEAELAWESAELALLLHYQANSRAAFEQRGWQVIFVGHDESLDIESVISLMEARGI